MFMIGEISPQNPRQRRRPDTGASLDTQNLDFFPVDADGEIARIEELPDSLNSVGERNHVPAWKLSVVLHRQEAGHQGRIRV